MTASLADIRRGLIEAAAGEREALLAFLAALVRARSPNPPGDTRDAAVVIGRYLTERGFDFRLIGPDPDRPNLVASFEGGAPGPHLVLNGHIDTFPAAAPERWTNDPFGGEVLAGRLYGTGACDMKQGVVSLVATYAWLNARRAHLTGRLTLTCVSDEETFGPAGARWLLDTHPDEFLGDCLLNSEPGAPTTVRFAEKAPLWIAIEIRTPGAHGAYTHKSPSATVIAAQLIEALAEVEATPVRLPSETANAIERGASEIDRIHLPGAARNMGRVTLNIGTWNAGTLVNMLPGHAAIEADIRLPWGVSSDDMISRVAAIVARFPAASMRVVSSQEAAWSDPSHPMVGLIQRNAREVAGLDVLPITSLAGTDARLWRQRGVPAFTYGVSATNVAMPDEHVAIDEWLGVVKTHALSALDYLTGSPAR